MGEWPKRVEGHFIDRELVSKTRGVEYRFHCIKCGLRITNPDEPSLKLKPCDSLVHGMGQGR